MRKGNRLLIILFLLLFFGGIGVGFIIGKHIKENKKEDKVVEPVKEPVDVSNLENFDIKMLKLENKKENMIYSPLSIKYALNLVRYGADGKTKDELDSVLGTKEITKYDNIKDHLSLANSVFIKTSFKDFVLSSYLEDVKNNLNTEIMYDDFKNAKNVNNWISEKTFDMLKDVVTDEQITNEDLRMLLINALAIDMEWVSPFDEANTRGQSFTKADGSKVEVTMMHSKLDNYNDDFKYYKDDNVSVISKDLKEYDGKQFELIAILPEENLEDYINNLKDNDLDDLFGKLTTVDSKSEVNLAIPKFEYDYSMDNFKENLKALGLVDMFDEETANFSKMASKELYVSDGIHKAKIEFGEKGVKAAAVTVIMMFEKSSIEPQKKNINITFDKPFMYVIRDKDSKEVWFMGTVYEPNLWKNDKNQYK